MSFVQRLRMANMFPVNADLGSASIDSSGDPMNDVIEAGKQLALFNRDVLNRPNGLQRVAQGNPLPGSGNFGNLFNRPTNFRVENAQATPLPPMEEGIRPGAENNIINKDASGENDIDKNLARATKISAIENANKRTDIAESNANKTKKRVIAITDPNDPTKQINAFYDENTEQVTPMKMTGSDTVQPGASAKTNLAKEEADKQKTQTSDDIRKDAQEALNVLAEIMDENGNFTPEGTRAFGLSSVGNMIPATKGFAGQKSVDRLKSLLTLSLLQKLKAHSKTGATGFGQLNLRELGVMEGGASKLDTGLNTSQAKPELERIREKLTQIMQPGPDESTESNSNKTNNSGERIRVKNKQTGQTGTISAGAFDPAKYDRVQ